MLESSIISRGYLSIDEIEEIHSVFILLDLDGSGTLSPDKLQKAIQRITKNSEAFHTNATRLYGEMDIDRDGSVTWPDFLNFISYWLVQFNVIRPKIKTDLPINSFEKEILHKGIAGIIANGYVNVQFNHVHVESLEARTETWDYLGEGRVYSVKEQKEYFEKVVVKVREDHFSRIRNEIQQQDIRIVWAGLNELKEMLGVLCCFCTSYDRQQVSEYLVSLFNQILSNNVMNLVINFLSYDRYEEIQWQALNILTLIVPGPRLPNFPNESKNFVRISKTILDQSGSLTKILQLCTSECIEVRGQALLAIGFIMRYDPDIRDFLYSQGGLQVLLRILQSGMKKLIDASSLVRAAWVLSIFTGATMDTKRLLPPKIGQKELQDIAETVISLFQSQDESNLLANSLISLSFVLPYLAINDFNNWVLDRLIELVEHEDFIVKKAVLQTIRNIICQGTNQCRVLIDAGLQRKINNVLAGKEDSLKLDACCILRILIEKGFTSEISNLSRLAVQLQPLITSNAETRWESIRIIKEIQKTNTKFAIEDLVRSGMIEKIFNSLLLFVDRSYYIADVYSDMPVFYHFGYLNDCLIILDKFLSSGWLSGDQKMPNSYLQYFQSDQAETLMQVSNILIFECKKGKELYQVSYGEVNVGNSLIELIDKFIIAHQNINDNTSINIVERLGSVSIFFKNLLRKDVCFNYEVDSSALLNFVQNFIVKTMDSVNYPLGENHIIQGVRKESFDYFHIKNIVKDMQINSKYGNEKKIEYNDSKNDKILVNNQESLNYAVLDSVNSIYQDYSRTLRQLGKPVPVPYAIPQVEIKLIVTTVQNTFGFSNYKDNASEISFQFINQKDLLLRDLAAIHSVSLSELESIYIDFFKAVLNRRPDGTLTRQEFMIMLTSQMVPETFAKQLFNAVDRFKSGSIDFRSYIAVISLLKRSDPQKICELVFSAYAKNDSSFLEKYELYDLILDNDKSKYSSLKDLVNHIFNVFARSSRENKLSCDDFIKAANSSYFNLDPLWMSFRGRYYLDDLVPCIQCGSKTVMQGIGIPSTCGQCSQRTPYKRQYYTH